MPIVAFDPTSSIEETPTLQLLVDPSRHIIFDNRGVEEEFFRSMGTPEMSHVLEMLSFQMELVAHGVLNRIRRFIGGIVEKFGGKVTVFIDHTITATPKGRLYLYQADCPDFTEKNLARHSFTQSDYLAIGFECCGDSMTGLLPYFKAGLSTGGVLIDKGPGDMEINPINNPSSNEERLSGMFSITAIDTSPLPVDTQSELIYRFWLSDGVGRNYTLEESGLTVKPITVQ